MGSPEEVSHLVDEMAADPDDKHMPASARTAYRCEKEATGELNRDTLINYINEIALNTPNNGLVEMRVAAQQQEKMGQRVEERIAAAICKNPRIMKAGITLEFKEVVQRVSQHMIANMDKMRINRLKDGVAPGAGVKWTAARTLD